MSLVANSLIILIAILHLYFLVLEMFFWTKPKGLKIFGQSLEKARSSATLAANQGLYNGFLSAGLLWSLVVKDPSQAMSLQVFFLSCVMIAGIFGAWTVSKKIFFVQALPALLGLVFICLK